MYGDKLGDLVWLLVIGIAWDSLRGMVKFGIGNLMHEIWYRESNAYILLTDCYATHRVSFEPKRGSNVLYFTPGVLL